MIVQAAELGDTGRQVVLWVAMGLALWQLLMFAASTFVQGKNLVKGLCTFTLLHGLPTLVQRLAIDQPIISDDNTTGRVTIMVIWVGSVFLPLSAFK